GRHQTTVPGYGMDEVFQVRQRNAEPANQHKFTLVHGVARPGGKAALYSGVNEPAPGEGFIYAQEVDPTDKIGLVEIEMVQDLPGLRKGRKVYGAFVRETFSVDGAEVLGVYADGQPAITRASYGKGHAVLIGTYVGLPFQRRKYPSNAALITGLVESVGGIARPHVVSESPVRVDVLQGPSGGAVVIVQNVEKRDVTASVSVPLAGPVEATEQFTGERLTWHVAGDLVTATVSLGPQEVRVYRG
ncbi:MAG TPA: hypothetical protein VFG50_03955, partial [Rhodothermales bacterium]|nr:hypothetical protein [Rhodothermales bacterium]